MISSHSNSRKYSDRRLATPLLLALSMQVGGVANAQSINPVVPKLQDVPSSDSTSLVLDTARTVFVSQSEAMPPAQAPAVLDRLRHLPAALSGWRIDGEMGTLEWPVYLAEGEVPTTRRFRLSYRSSASVLPDNSVIVLTVNDVVVGKAAIASPATVKPIEFEIPPDLLRRGFNAVRISVDQRHRVDCSLDATYELWTRIIPAESGFLTDTGADRPQISLVDLAALRPRSDGALPIEVVWSGRMKPHRVDQVLAAAQAIAVAGRFQKPVVHFAPEQKTDAGVKLVVGTSSEIAALEQLPEGRAPISGPTTFFLPKLAGGPPTLVVTGSTEEDLAAAILQLAGSTRAEMTGTPSGLRAAKNLAGVAVSGGERIRLSDVGFTSTEFSGRFFRLGIEIAMPPDFLAADYAKFTVDLAGGYAAGLNSDAQVRVEVNGKNAASVALPDAWGDVFRHNEILVPLGLLQPGSNRIEIIAQLQNKSDARCEATDSPDQNAKRFLLLANTEIHFPAIARLGRMPDLRPLAAGGFPFVNSGSPSRLFVPVPDRASLSAALTVAVRMAVAAQDLIPFTLTLGRSDDVAVHTLIVAPAQALDPKLMEVIGLDPDIVRQAWQDRIVPKKAAAPLPSARVVLRHIQTENQTSVNVQADNVAPRALATALPAPNSDAVLDTAATELADQWADMIGHRSVWNEFSSAISSIVGRASNFARTTISETRTRVAAADTPGSRPIDSRASLIVAQGQRSGSDKGTITIVTAPESADLMRSVELLVDPIRWSSLGGRLSVMGGKDDPVEAVEASHFYYSETQPRSFGNARLIAAGWFSLNPLAYVVSALLLAAFLASATLSLIRSAGRISK